MRLEVRKYLHDILGACELIEEFVVGKDFADYETEIMLRPAVEREFEMIGEAMAQMLKLAPELSDVITASRRIIAFRNMLIHGYATVSNEIVWGVVQANLPRLKQEVATLLEAEAPRCTDDESDG